jgi:hypothetical protein
MKARRLPAISLLAAAGALAGALGGCASVGTTDENPSWRTEYHWLGSQGRRAHTHRFDAPAQEHHHHHAPRASAAYEPTDLGPEPAQILPLLPAAAGDCCKKACSASKPCSEGASAPH